jgi:acyl carrier protein
MNEPSELIRRRIVGVVSAVFGLPAEQVAAGVTPQNVEGWSSEKHVELVLALEECFGCTFEPEDVPELTSLEKMEVIIARHV